HTAAADQPARLRHRDGQEGAVDRRRRIHLDAARGRAAARPWAGASLRPAAMRRPIARGLLAVLVLLVTDARAAEEVVTGTLSVSEGQAVVEMTVSPGWHVNAHDPRDDFLVPTTLTVRPPDG